MSGKSGSIVRPRPFPGSKARRVLYVPVDSPSGLIRRSAAAASRKTLNAFFSEVHYLQDAAVVLGALGAPHAVLVLEQMIASGAEDIVVLGFCGALDARVSLLDAALVVKAYSDEGTSRHYLPEKDCFLPDRSLTGEIEAGLRRRGLPLVEGRVVSTDAPFRETPEWRAASLARGAGLVDMETSAVFALAAHHGIKAAALLLVSDVLRGSDHVVGFKSPQLEKRLRDYFLPFLLPGSAG
jgi:uridine phosphorylase